MACGRDFNLVLAKGVCLRIITVYSDHSKAWGEEIGFGTTLREGLKRRLDHPTKSKKRENPLCG